ncbi:hypothetical protein E2C01_013157 [Portunus trituberculatus]|uniref:Uncharacterized protein n=1 Tax=Portunus trituberculatus TaxID=210409 RepID=A0A5B7DFG9_PORTR|nr:hypothetical protein [Portunus trituberculatus]
MAVKRQRSRLGCRSFVSRADMAHAASVAVIGLLTSTHCLTSCRIPPSPPPSPEPYCFLLRLRFF